MLEPTFLLLISGILLIVFLIDAAMLYVAAHVLKFKETGFKKALMVTGANWCAALGITLLAALAYFYLGMNTQTDISTISFISLILSLAALIYMIKHYYHEDWNDTILAFLIVIAVQIVVTLLFSFVFIAPFIFWQLGGINLEEAATPVVATASGWEKILPVQTTESYTATGVFDTTFVNAVGIGMKIEAVEITDTNGNTPCTNIIIKGIDTNINTIPQGGVIDMTAKCQEKNSGEPYELNVKIDYTAALGRVNSREREEGTITGTVA
jgi:hypothetical protein